MSDLIRVRWLHLSTQILAVAGIVALFTVGGEEIASLGMPAKEYRVEFSGRLSDMERGKAGSKAEVRESIRFLVENVPQRIRLQRTFLRMLAVLGLIIILPVGVGAWIHGRLARRLDAGGEAFRTLAAAGWVLGIISALGVASSVAYASVRLDRASEKVAELKGVPDGQDEASAVEAFRAVRNAGRRVRGCIAVALTVVGMTFLLGVAFSFLGIRRLLTSRSRSPTG